MVQVHDSQRNNLGAIARKFGVPIEPIRTVNGLKGSRIVATSVHTHSAKGADEQVLKKLEYKKMKQRR